MVEVGSVVSATASLDGLVGAGAAVGALVGTGRAVGALVGAGRAVAVGTLRTAVGSGSAALWAGAWPTPQALSSSSRAMAPSRSSAALIERPTIDSWFMFSPSLVVVRRCMKERT